jgi:hypothetical protein
VEKQATWRDAQVPSTQDSPAAQAVAHAPQWKRSRSRWTQAPPQSVSPAPQVAEQVAGPAAAEQTVPWQARAQEPQWPGSEARSTHVAPQAESPGAQSQAPRWQVARASQALPQAPQLAASTAGSTQAPAQSTSPAGQVTSFWQAVRAAAEERAAARRSERVMESLRWVEWSRRGG